MPFIVSWPYGASPFIDFLLMHSHSLSWCPHLCKSSLHPTICGWRWTSFSCISLGFQICWEVSLLLYQGVSRFLCQYVYCKINLQCNGKSTALLIMMAANRLCPPNINISSKQRHHFWMTDHLKLISSAFYGQNTLKSWSKWRQLHLPQAVCTRFNCKAFSSYDQEQARFWIHS